MYGSVGGRGAGVNKVMGGREGDGGSGWDGCSQVSQIHVVVWPRGSVLG